MRYVIKSVAGSVLGNTHISVLICKTNQNLPAKCDKSFYRYFCNLVLIICI